MRSEVRVLPLPTTVRGVTACQTTETSGFLNCEVSGRRNVRSSTVTLTPDYCVSLNELASMDIALSTLIDYGRRALAIAPGIPLN